MRARDVNTLRTQIIALHAEGATPTEISRRLNCSRSTVYHALDDPGPDRRADANHPRRTPAAIADRVAQLAADGRSIDNVKDLIDAEHGQDAPSRATVARIAARSRPDPYQGLGLSSYDAAAAADPDSLESELILIRALIRPLVAELADPHLTQRRASQLEQRIRRLIDTLNVVYRTVHARDTGNDTPLDTLLAQIAEEITKGATP